MATDAVMLPPSLRPWQRAGVEFLLAEQPLPAPYSLCLAASPLRPQQATRPAQTATARQFAPQGQAAPQGCSAPHGQPTPQGQPPHAQDSAPRPPLPRSTSAPAVASASPETAQAGLSSPRPAAPSALAPNLWPSDWQERLKKTAPAAVLWTYWTLGEDLCVRPNPVRRALLQRLLADLAHPAGTHSFWPAALPAQEGEASADCTLQANPEVFWSGVHALKARALVVMGSPAIKALELPPRLRPFQQTRHNGRLVVVLRDVDFLAQETHRYDAVCEFLKQALAPFGR